MLPMQRITLKQLRTLTAVVRHGTMAAAAESLHITAPAVTIQMRQLEEAAGLPLLDRTAEGFRPTEAGREVLEAAARIERALAECGEALAEMRDLQTGRVSVAVVSTAKYFAPQALAAFARERPKIAIRILVGNRGDTIAALESYEADIAIMGRPPENLQVEAMTIGPHPHVIVAPPDHPKARMRSIRPAALADETFLLREPGSGTRILMETLFADTGVTPRIGMEIGSNETIKQAVMAGLGIALISAHTVAVELRDGRLVALPVEGLPIVRQWFVVKRSDKRLLPAARALRDFLVEKGRTFLPA